jgi:hypothetical protein
VRVQGSPAKNFFPTSVLTLKQVKIRTDKLLARKKDFLQFVTQKPLSKFKELIVTSPRLLRGQYTMSMMKTASDGLKAKECERIKLREPPPVPYVPVRDEVQDEVSKMRNMEIKTTIEKDTMLNFPVWKENGTREGFLMHVQAVLDAIKKRGHFEDYNKAAWKFREASKAIASARTGLSLLEETVKKASKEKKRSGKKRPRKVRRPRKART